MVEKYQKEQDITDQLNLIRKSECVQRHMVQKAAADVEECVMDINSGDDVSKGFIS